MKKFLIYGTTLAAVLIVFAMLARKGNAYEAVAVTDGGSLSGVVTLAGAVPKLEAMVISKDPKTCGKGNRPSTRLIVSSNKGVANTVVRLKNVQKGKELKIPAKPGTLDQNKCGFTPHIQVVAKGGKIAIKNSDPILHNIHAFMGTKTVFNLAMPLENQVIKKKLKKAGIIRVQCDAGHVWMNAYLVVTDHPYVAITDKNGKYEIKDIPPGKYEVEFWHEGWKVAKKLPDGTITYSKPLVSVKEATIQAKKKTTLNFQLAGK